MSFHFKIIINSILILFAFQPMFAVPNEGTVKNTVDLLSAAEIGDLKKVQTLVEKGLPVNSRNSNGSTALHYAASEGKIQVVNYLLSKKADVNVTNNYGITPLHFSAQGGFLITVQTLISNGADIAISAPDYGTPFDVAVGNVKIEVAKYLVKSGANAIEGRGKKGNTPLHWAVNTGNTELIRYILSLGASPNERNNDGDTPLHLAAQKKSLSVVKLLIKEKADVNVRGKLGISPLHYAVLAGSYSSVKALIRSGASIDYKSEYGYRAIHFAAAAGDSKILRYLIKKDAIVKCLDRNGNTPLHWAARKGIVKNIRYLVQNKVEVNYKNADGDTALHLSASEGYYHATKYLIRKGGDISLQNNDGKIPLDRAVMSRKKLVIRYLANLEKRNRYLLNYCRRGSLRRVKYYLKMYAGLNTRDEDGNTPLHLAVKYRRKSITYYLIRKGANRYATNNDGDTPEDLSTRESITRYLSRLEEKDDELRTASEEGDIKTVYRILKAPVNINQPDDDGNTALFMAVKSGHLKVVKTLIRYGADYLARTNYDGKSSYGVALGNKQYEVMDYLKSKGAN